MHSKLFKSKEYYVATIANINTILMLTDKAYRVDLYNYTDKDGEVINVLECQHDGNLAVLPQMSGTLSYVLDELVREGLIDQSTANKIETMNFAT